MNAFGVNTNSDFYQRVRSGTTTAWEVTSCAVGAYGLAKGAFYGTKKIVQYSSAQIGRRTSKMMQTSTVQSNLTQAPTKKPLLEFTRTTAKHMSEPG